MYEVSVFVTATLLIVSGVFYAYYAWIGKTDPVLATWILMAVVTGLSLWMYWESPHKSWTGNIALTSGSVNIVTILFGVTAAHLRRGTLRIAFDVTQKWCLIGGVAIVPLWWITNNSLVSYVLVQLISIVAILATAERLWNSERNSEPLFIWVVAFFAMMCAIYPAWVKHDTFSWIYLGRAIPSTVLIIYLIVRIERKVLLSSA